MHTARPPASTIRVLVLSGHRLVRCTLPELLKQEGFRVISSEETIAATVRVAAATMPDVALLSNRVPDGTGIEACRALREAAPATRCVIMTTYDDRKALRAAALADAAGYIPLSPRPGTLADAVWRVAAGERLHSPKAAAAIARGGDTFALLRGAPDPERAIWSLILQGRTNTEIIQELALPPQTFCTRLSSLLARLGYRPQPTTQFPARCPTPPTPT